MKNINLAEKNGQWKGGINHDYCQRVAFEYYPRKCMVCESLKNLQVHHKNRNRKDNRKENLAILCIDCHHKVHEHLVEWSIHGNRCKNCERNDKKHNANGLCMNCYMKITGIAKKSYEKNKEKRLLKDKEYYEKNKVKKLAEQKERRNDPKFVEYHRQKSREWSKKNRSSKDE